MDRKFASDFDFSQFCGKINDSPISHESEIIDGESSDVRSALLDAIYALDPITGLPTGDIAVYCSPKTSLEVKQFILDNIMIDTSVSATPRNYEVSDDDLIALARKDKESRQSYIERIQNYMTLQSNIIHEAQRDSNVPPVVAKE